MSNRNDITGDRLISKTLSKQGQDNWDLIFKKKKETDEDTGDTGRTGKTGNIDCPSCKCGEVCSGEET